METPIRKVLIANRGEIACRIMRSLDRLGIASVAVYSEADSQAMHVEMAGEAVLIGAAPSSDSYLNQARVIDAALQTGADAIHPGYGFLSENPGFVRACGDAGIVFIGPDADAIEAMGLKDAAKSRMEQAGVPVVPGYHGDNQDPAFLAGKADETGYPVLIKASAGGGGKGMRRVDDPADFVEALAGAQREGKASFDDPRVLIEKYVTAPRHIEIQVFGDRHGNVVHLFERDCSLQRRHQKVVEEAPAPGMTTSMRTAMGSAAVDAAKAVNYVGAGTVEFIVDASDGLRDDRFYFMEMNTRLQVEHPVTEAITGVDLVEWQIAVANGQPLPRRQDQLSVSGHAMEARLYAEDTDAGFLPATGTLTRLRFDSTARIDTGVTQGDAISPFYDPMIAKIIVHGHDRQAAIGKLSRALWNTRIAGCVTNQGFLGRLINTPAFVAGDVITSLIADHGGTLGKPNPVPGDVVAAAALYRIGMIGSAQRQPRADSPWRTLQGFRNWGQPRYLINMAIDGCALSLTVQQAAADRASITYGGESALEVAVSDRSVQRTRLLINGRSVQPELFWDNNVLNIFSGGDTWRVSFAEPGSTDSAAVEGGNQVIAPMPGTVTALNVKARDSVSKGDTLAVLEAMKMEHSLRAEVSGSVESVNVEQGDQVDAGEILISLVPADSGTTTT